MPLLFSARALLALLLVILLQQSPVAEAKKGASNRVPLGTVRVSNIELNKFKKLNGPTNEAKVEMLEQAKLQLKNKLAAKERSDAARAAAIEAKEQKEKMLRKRLKSSLLVQAIARRRAAAGEDQDDEVEEEE